MNEKRMAYGQLFGLIWRNFSFMKGRRLLFFVGGVLSLGRLAMSFLIPYLFQQLITLSGSAMTAPEALRLVGLPFGLLLILAPLVCLGGFWQKESAHLAAGAMQKAVFGQVVRMSVQDLETGRGDKLMRATENAKGAASMLSGYSIQNLMMFLINFFGALVLLLVADWRFALLGVALSAIIFWLSTFLNTRLRSLERSAQESEAKAVSRLLEMVTNLPIVKLYLLENPLTQGFRDAGAAAYASRMKHKRLRGLTDGAMDFLTYSGQSAAIFVGVVLLAGPDFPGLVYVAGLLDVMLAGMRELGFFIQFIQSSVVSSQRMYELMAEPVEPDRPSAQAVDPSHEWAVEFDRVNFSYANGQPVLQDLNLKIRRGKTTAIVGPSGCGKTTLLRLVQRLYTPDSGEISILGAAQSGLSNQDIRRAFALIPQEPGLFDGTVEDNLRLGHEGASSAAIHQALERASLADLGEGTPVGESGGKISGGQRQRVAIARALLRDAPIYLLDEAASALDVNTEGEIWAALGQALAGRTVICVAHRLASITDADEILYMEEGQVKERGRHEELMALEGGYWRLVQAGQ